MVRGTAAKNIRRKNAIPRLERALAQCEQELKTCTDDDEKVQKILKTKIAGHKTTIENTKRSLKSS